MGSLSKHVLDTANGTPARGMCIALSRRQAGAWEPIKAVISDDDGRTGGPLLEGPALVKGEYLLMFDVGAYFRELRRTAGIAVGTTLPDPPFLDQVPLQFGIADAAGHYHVPLLCSPWSYSTYRGS